MSLLAKLVLWVIGEFIVIGLLLFGLAGTVHWPAGWLFFGLMFGLGAILSVWLYRCSRGLLEERVESLQHSRPGWDRAFIVALMILFLVWLAIMPLDAVRFGWSHVPRWLQAVGLVLFVVSWWIFFVVFRENPYTSAAIRIQRERGQELIDTGPYAHVRHPMYGGAVLLFLGASLLCGSWGGVIVTALLTVLLALRTKLEEGLLRRELEGYEEYMGRVRWRMVPRVW